MNRDQAREIYKEIEHLFPLFRKDATEESVKLWLDRLEHGEYEPTKRKLVEYSFESTYPPTLAHILVRKHEPPKNDLAEQIQEAKEAVRKEREDPEKRKQHDALYQQLKRKLEGVDDFD